jgi:hypothetical protein
MGQNLKTLKNLITFKPYRPWLDKKHVSAPASTQSEIPTWYKKADRFAKMPNGEYYKADKTVCPFPKKEAVDDYGKVPTWKACPSIFDAFTTGYVLKTPCDITFFKNERGMIDVNVSDSQYKDFCSPRHEMPQFEHPKGFQKDHFAWYSHWGIELPDGYSALFMTPMNRFDLPFLNTTGIVDCDKVKILGTIPFFMPEGWEGVLPAGTPYLQVLPFKREDWISEIVVEDVAVMYNKNLNNMKKYRVPDGGIYKNEVWSKREYK